MIKCRLDFIGAVYLTLVDSELKKLTEVEHPVAITLKPLKRTSVLHQLKMDDVIVNELEEAPFHCTVGQLLHLFVKLENDELFCK